MSTKDLFSEHASDYAAFRPDYPMELYEFIFNQVQRFDFAWDCGTGNGQAAKILSVRFEKVFATDISDRQMEMAIQASNIFYSVSKAEETIFPDNQFDLITVAQAVHWFDLKKFYSEVLRTAKPNSVVAIWGYGLLRIEPQMDLAIDHFYKNVIGPYWDAERILIDHAYSTLEFPFEEVIVPKFTFVKKWDAHQLEGYLTTWSAVQKFIKKNSSNPVLELMETLKGGFEGSVRDINFPLFSRVGVVRK